MGTGRFTSPPRTRVPPWGKQQNGAPEVGTGRAAFAHSLLARVGHVVPKQQGSLGDGVRGGGPSSVPCSVFLL